MSERDLVKELKAEIVEITKDRDDVLDKMKSKESRMKQVLIKLEHATADVHSCGHKIGEQNKEIAELKAKLETKSKPQPKSRTRRRHSPSPPTRQQQRPAVIRTELRARPI